MRKPFGESERLANFLTWAGMTYMASCPIIAVVYALKRWAQCYMDMTTLP